MNILACRINNPTGYDVIDYFRSNVILQNGRKCRLRRYIRRSAWQHQLMGLLSSAIDLFQKTAQGTQLQSDLNTLQQCTTVTASKYDGGATIVVLSFDY